MGARGFLAILIAASALIYAIFINIAVQIAHGLYLCAYVAPIDAANVFSLGGVPCTIAPLIWGLTAFASLATAFVMTTILHLVLSARSNNTT